MFGGMMQEDDEPGPSDVGRFIPQSQLEGWWKEMQVKVPQVFGKDEVCPQQVRQDTKIRAYFDGDKSKEMNATVLGSKFRTEFSGKYPMYVVRMKNSPELAYIHLTEVGEEEGWFVVE